MAAAAHQSHNARSSVEASQDCASFGRLDGRRDAIIGVQGQRHERRITTMAIGQSHREFANRRHDDAAINSRGSEPRSATMLIERIVEIEK